LPSVFFFFACFLFAPPFCFYFNTFLSRNCYFRGGLFRQGFLFIEGAPFFGFGSLVISLFEVFIFASVYYQ